MCRYLTLKSPQPDDKGGCGLESHVFWCKMSAHAAPASGAVHCRVGFDFSSMSFAEFEVDFCQLLQSEDVVVVHIVHVNAFAVGTAKVQRVFYDFNALLSCCIFISKLFMCRC